MIVPRVVAEGEGRIALQLGLRPLPQILVDQRRHRHGDPLLARPQCPAALARITWFAPARPPGHAIFISVRISGAGIDRVGKNQEYGGPSRATRAAGPTAE